MPPSDPYAIAGKVYDRDGTVVSGCIVNAYNQANHEWLIPTNMQTTEADGTYSLDIAGSLSGVSAGDIIFIMVKDANDKRSAWARHVAVAGRSGIENLYLQGTPSAASNTKLLGFVASLDGDTTSYYFDLYDIYYDVVKMRVTVSPEAGTVAHSSKQGVWFVGGIAVIEEDASAQELHITLELPESTY